MNKRNYNLTTLGAGRFHEATIIAYKSLIHRAMARGDKAKVAELQAVLRDIERKAGAP